jgi:cytochrome c biogenesis protein CcmG, thiol:disulfide interchange protein DsbE
MGAVEATPTTRKPWVAPAVGVLTAVAVALGYFWLTAPEVTKIKVGMQAPELELPSVNPGSVKLSSFRGQAVLLAFFMSDCKICQKEVVEIERIHREYRLKGLLVVGVSVDADYAATRRFLAERQLTFGLLRDPNGEKIFAAYGSYKMPEAYLIDPQGIVRGVFLGSVAWRSPEVRRQIEDVLPAPSPAPSLPSATTLTSGPRA